MSAEMEGRDVEQEYHSPSMITSRTGPKGVGSFEGDSTIAARNVEALVWLCTNVALELPSRRCHNAPTAVKRRDCQYGCQNDARRA